MLSGIKRLVSLTVLAPIGAGIGFSVGLIAMGIVDNLDPSIRTKLGMNGNQSIDFIAIPTAIGYGTGAICALS